MTTRTGPVPVLLVDDNNTTILDEANTSVRVTIVSGGASGGTSATDDDAFTAGAGSGTPVMGFFSTDTVDAGDVGVLAMDASRRLLVSIEADNVGIGGGTQYTEDAAAAANPVGNALIMVRDDALSAQTTTDGDNVAARGTDKGELYVKHADTMVVDGSAVTQPVSNAGLTELAAAINASSQMDVNIAASGATVPVSGTFFQATQPVSVATIPSHAVTNAGTFAVQVDGSALTALQLIDNIVGSINGPGAPVIDSYTHAAFNLTAAADQVLAASAANKQIWVYGIGFTLSAAGTVSFQDEDNVAITGIMPFATNSGMMLPPSGNFAMPLWKCATDKDFEVDLVTAEMDGWIDYAVISV